MVSGSGGPSLMRSSYAVASCACPGVTTKPIASPSAFDRAWSFVVKPPRERPRPFRRVPPSSGSVVVRPDDGGVDHLHQIIRRLALDERRQDDVPEARLG